jgi:hypothetical protein
MLLKSLLKGSYKIMRLLEDHRIPRMRAQSYVKRIEVANKCRTGRGATNSFKLVITLTNDNQRTCTALVVDPSTLKRMNETFCVPA